MQIIIYIHSGKGVPLKSIILCQSFCGTFVFGLVISHLTILNCMLLSSVRGLNLFIKIPLSFTILDFNQSRSFVSLQPLLLSLDSSPSPFFPL